MANKTISQTSNEKQYLTATFFSIFLGWLGVDRFYLGHVGLGIVKLLTFGGFGIWWLIDIIWIGLGNAKTQSGVVLERTESATKVVYVGLAIFVIFEILGGVLGALSLNSTLNSLNNSLFTLSDTLKGSTVQTTTTDNGTTKTITFPSN